MAKETSKRKDKVEEYNDLLSKMNQQKEKWDEEDDQDEQDRLLSNAIDLAIQQGKGWGPGEKEAYLEKILDDDFYSSHVCHNAGRNGAYRAARCLYEP